MKRVIDRLTSYAIFYKKQTAILLGLYFLFRITSFALFGQPIVQSILTGLVFLIFSVTYFKNPKWAWYILLGELLLAGSGHFIQFFGVSIRSILFINFIGLTFLHQWGDEYFYTKSQISNKAITIISLVFLTVAASTIIGLVNGHGVEAIRDAIPFAYLLLFFPAFYICRQKEDVEEMVQIIIVFIIGTALFSLFTFILFSGGIVELQDSFYKWFRDVNLGKITDMGRGFFRIVEPSHLLATPIILIISSLLMRDEKHHHMWRFLLFCGVLIFVLNLSRIYILALAAGFVVLFYKHKWKRWLKITGSVAAQVIAIFMVIHLIASGFTSPGWELFGFRVNSIAEPTTEKSASTRLMMLPAIKEQILTKPFLGHGLGSSLTFQNKNTYEEVTTHQYDWGYFEMLVEFGFIGTAILLGSLFFLMISLIKKIENFSDYEDLHVGLLAGLIALGVINLTSPALFHIYSIIYIVFVAIITLKTPDIFDEIVTTLYRVFHRVTED